MQPNDYYYMAFQPIVDEYRRIISYELLYRDVSKKAAIVNPDVSSRFVLSKALTVFDLLNRTNVSLSINFTRNLIMDGFVRKADPDRIIVQLPENTRIDEPLQEKLTDLIRDGYVIALKNYTGQSWLRPNLRFFHIVRVNFMKTNSVFQKEAVRRHGLPDTVFLADKVEREQDFDAAHALGYSYFQGFFYEKPTLMNEPIPPLLQTAYGQMLSVLLKDPHTVQWEVECSRIIKSDMMLSYLFPREIAAMPQSLFGNLKKYRTDRDIVQTAVYHMGPHALRRWVCLALMKENNVSKDADLPRKAYLRGMFMEELAKNSELRVDVSEEGGNVFLLGVISLIQEIMGPSPVRLFRGMDLPRPMWDAVTGRTRNDYSLLLQYVLLYEQRKPHADLPDIRAELDASQIQNKYRMCGDDADAAVKRMDTPANDAL